MSVVFLCVGAAKAGTSWLHAQLSNHPECHFRTLKELHYFNALEDGKLNRELRKHRDQQAAVLDRVARRADGPSDAQIQRLADRGAWLDVLERRGEDLEAYLAYLHAGQETRKVVGEMTPAYALLPAERLEKMAKMAPDVRFLYLLRDPVERLWSHVRMMAGRRADDGVVTAKSSAHILERTLHGAEDQIAMRSDYASAINKLAASVPRAKVIFEVFEDVVAGDGLNRICDFLGISRMKPDSAPIHAGQTLEMTPKQREMSRKWLENQYVAAQAALGRMPAAWAHGGVST
jgi:hypothetical protein